MWVLKSTEKFFWAKTPERLWCDMKEAVPPADFVQAMGQHVSSVCVITTLWQGEQFGLTATAVSSVCANPPRLLVCVNKSGFTHDKIIATGHFGVNVLADSQEKIGKSFAGMLGKDFDRFSVGQWRVGSNGSPLLRDAAAVFDCTIVQALDQFSHTILIGEVMDASAGIGRDALLYGARRFRNLRKILPTAAPDDMETLHF
jgi:flavin reductase (DIM6/NTAB) family NADH-FMN oxidoreductase RutF